MARRSNEKEVCIEDGSAGTECWDRQMEVRVPSAASGGQDWSTSRIGDTQRETLRSWDWKHASRFRALAARLTYLAADRPDLQFSKWHGRVLKTGLPSNQSAST